MKLFFFLLFLYWLYNYWRFTGKRAFYRKMVFVMQHRFDRMKTEQSALELASAYMQVQRYKDAYSLFNYVLESNPGSLNARDIRMNLDFCMRPFPWSGGLKNHDMGYWHNFLLVRFGRTRKVMLSNDAYVATDIYMKNGYLG